MKNEEVTKLTFPSICVPSLLKGENVPYSLLNTQFSGQGTLLYSLAFLLGH
jgi:hypothetical protein